MPDKKGEQQIRYSPFLFALPVSARAQFRLELHSRFPFRIHGGRIRRAQLMPSATNVADTPAKPVATTVQVAVLPFATAPALMV